MHWFSLLWTILFATAVNVHVSDQELTTVLPQDDDACMRNEVTFTCTIRGSLTLTDLILAWSSNEYIGQGGALQFTSESMLGANMSSMINGNVTAILTNSTMIDGVPVLESILHIIGANQTSMITCSSNSGTSEKTMFFGSAFPGRPQNGEARERSAGNCDFQVTWDRPTNIDIFDIDRYIIYVPSQNIMNVSSSTTIGLIIPNCRIGNNSIQVAAVNRFGCEGPNSSHIQLSLLEIQNPPSGGLSAPVVGGIVVGVCVLVIIIAVAITAAIIVVYNAQEDIKQEHKRDEENFTKKLGHLIEAIRELHLTIGESESNSSLRPSTSTQSVPTLTCDLLELMENLAPSDIKEGLTKVLKTNIIILSARHIQETLQQVKKWIPSTFVPLLQKDLSVTTDQLIEAAEKGNHQKDDSSIAIDQPNDSEALMKGIHQELLDKLKKQVEEANPEDVKDQLQKLFKALLDYFKNEEVKQGVLLQAHREDFAKYLEYLIKAIRERSSTHGRSTPLVPIFAHNLLELMKKLEPSDIKGKLKTTVFETKEITASDIQETLHQLKKWIPKVILAFDRQKFGSSESMDKCNDSEAPKEGEHQEVGSSVTINQLIKAPKKDHQELVNKLKKQVEEAKPEVVKRHLRNLFQALQDHHAGHARNPVARIVSIRRRVSLKAPTVTLEEKVRKMTNERADELLQSFYKELQGHIKRKVSNGGIQEETEQDLSVEQEETAIQKEIPPEQSKELIQKFIKMLQESIPSGQASRDDNSESAAGGPRLEVPGHKPPIARGFRRRGSGDTSDLPSDRKRQGRKPPIARVFKRRRSRDDNSESAAGGPMLQVQDPSVDELPTLHENENQGDGGESNDTSVSPLISKEVALEPAVAEEAPGPRKEAVAIAVEDSAF